jgi:hypothetical protein
MDKATFERLVSIPGTISENEAVLLEDLAQAFPYCQSAHVLLAQESHQKKSMLYPKKLRRASTYMLDRKVLHQLLHPSTATISTAEKPILVQENTIPTPIGNEKNISILEELEETLRETRKRLHQSPFKSDAIVSVKPKPAETTKDLFLQENIYNIRSESRLGEELNLHDELDHSDVDVFLDYLHQIQNFKPKSIQPQNLQLDVIEKFLETQPRISTPSSLLPSEETTDLSIESTQLKTEPITENYAQILVKQNKLEKATEVYNKLILKYPDKSAYFAAKLNELENK